MKTFSDSLTTLYIPSTVKTDIDRLQKQMTSSKQETESFQISPSAESRNFGFTGWVQDLKTDKTVFPHLLGRSIGEGVSYAVVENRITDNLSTEEIPSFDIATISIEDSQSAISSLNESRKRYSSLQERLNFSMKQYWENLCRRVEEHTEFSQYDLEESLRSATNRPVFVKSSSNNSNLIYVYSDTTLLTEAVHKFWSTRLKHIASNQPLLKLSEEESKMVEIDGGLSDKNGVTVTQPASVSINTSTNATNNVDSERYISQIKAKVDNHLPSPEITHSLQNENALLYLLDVAVVQTIEEHCRNKHLHHLLSTQNSSILSWGSTRMSGLDRQTNKLYRGFIPTHSQTQLHFKTPSKETVVLCSFSWSEENDTLLPQIVHNYRQGVKSSRIPHTIQTATVFR
jgi:hypothetical protein